MKGGIIFVNGIKSFEKKKNPFPLFFSVCLTGHRTFVSSPAGFQRKFPDPTRWSRPQDPPAGEASLLSPPPTSFPTGPIRVAVGGGLCKQRQCYPSLFSFLSPSHISPSHTEISDTLSFTDMLICMLEHSLMPREPTPVYYTIEQPQDISMILYIYIYTYRPLTSRRRACALRLANHQPCCATRPTLV